MYLYIHIYMYLYVRVFIRIYVPAFAWIVVIKDHIHPSPLPNQLGCTGLVK